MALAKPIVQEDWSAGMWRSRAPHLIPANGAYDIVNGLLNDDGSVYRRGGSVALSPAFGSGGIQWIWDGFLAPGARTVVANPSDYGVLASDDTSAVVNLGGAGLSAPTKAVAHAGILHIGGGVLYGGTRKTADYSTGTVTTVLGSAAIVGAGTSWAANVDAGMLFRVGGSGRYYVVSSVTDNTHLTLTEVYEAAGAAGASYAATVLGSASTYGKVSSCYCVCADRLLAPTSNLIPFSGIGAPQTFGATDYHELPEGVQVLGAESVQNTALIFTTHGLWTITNMAYDLTDDFGNPQQQFQAANRDLILWSNEGIASWRGALVVPATDGVWLVDPVSGPTLVSEAIGPLLTGYVAAGHHVGQAQVFRSHYFMPVLNSSNAIVDVLVCRLDRPGTPWVRLAGSGVNVSGFDQRVGSGSSRASKLLCANLSSSKVETGESFFAPAAAVKKDADTTTHSFTLTTRDYTTGPMNANLVKKLRATYELTDAASDNPTIALAWAKDRTAPVWGQVTWGDFTWSTTGDEGFVTSASVAPEDPLGTTPYSWFVNMRARRIRFRLRCSTACQSLTVRSLEGFVRQSAKP